MYLYRGKFYVCVFKPVERKFIDILIVLKRRDASIINSGIWHENVNIDMN